MDHRLLFGDASAVDEALHEGVVDRHLLEHAVAEQVDTRVADVGESDLVAHSETRVPELVALRTLLGPAAGAPVSHTTPGRRRVVLDEEGAVRTESLSNSFPGSEVSILIKTYTPNVVRRMEPRAHEGRSCSKNHEHEKCRYGDEPG